MARGNDSKHGNCNKAATALAFAHGGLNSLSALQPPMH